VIGNYCFASARYALAWNMQGLFLLKQADEKRNGDITFAISPSSKLTLSYIKTIIKPYYYAGTKIFFYPRS
jgi:hypothetical protein